MLLPSYYCNLFCVFRFVCIVFIIFFVLQFSKEKNDVDVQQQQRCDVAVDSEATVVGAGMEKRQHKPAAVMKSPFLNEFGSSESKVVGKRQSVDVVKQILPFKKQLGFITNDEDIEAFSKWYHDGYRPKNK